MRLISKSFPVTKSAVTLVFSADNYHEPLKPILVAYNVLMQRRWGNKMAQMPIRFSSEIQFLIYFPPIKSIQIYYNTTLQKQNFKLLSVFDIFNNK